MYWLPIYYSQPNINVLVLLQPQPTFFSLPQKSVAASACAVLEVATSSAGGYGAAPEQILLPLRVKHDVGFGETFFDRGFAFGC